MSVINLSNKMVLASLILTSMTLVACQKQDASTEIKTQQEATVAPKQNPPAQKEMMNEPVIPAMLAKSEKMPLKQPRICAMDDELQELVCVTTEVIALKSNIAWIDQRLNQEIQKDYAANLSAATAKQAEINKTDAELMRNWSNSVSYRFNGQFGQYVQVSKVNAEYSGGAHGMFYLTSYVFDLKNKNQVKLDDIIIKNKKTDLKNKLWTAYEEWCADHDNMEAFLNKEDFNISENFYINQNGGLTFDYQLYELAPYVYGPVSLELHETDGLIKAEFLAPTPSFQSEY